MLWSTGKAQRAGQPCWVSAPSATVCCMEHSMNSQSYLQEFIKDCSQAKPAATDEKFVGWENIIFILAGIGLKALLPELREWLKLGAMAITTKRLELKKKLLEYAKQRELDYQEAE